MCSSSTGWLLVYELLSKQDGKMTDSDPQPTNIEELEWAVWPSFALLAGIRLDLFTPLKDGPLSAEQLANNLGGASL